MFDAVQRMSSRRETFIQCQQEPNGHYHRAVISAGAQRPVTREMMEDFLF